MFVCINGDREYSAMLGDNEVPEKCPDCGGDIVEKDELKTKVRVYQI